MKKKFSLFVTVVFLLSSSFFKVYSQNTLNSEKRVLVEQVTEARNGWAPAGLVKQAELKKMYGDRVVFINIHRSDNAQLFTFEGNYIMTAFSDTIPSGIIDRKLFSGHSIVALLPDEWQQAVSSQLAENPAVDVQITNITVDGLDVSITAEVTFLEDVFGDIRMSCAVVENYVKNESKDFSQVNFFNNTPGHPFYGLGDTIHLFEHHRVLRGYFSSAWGDFIDQDSINPAGHYWPKGTKRTVTFSRQVFTNVNQMYAVVFVNKFNSNDVNDRNVFNVTQQKLTTVGIDEDHSARIKEAGIYPNPARQWVHVSFNLNRSSAVHFKIIDMSGKTVKEFTAPGLSSGTHHYQINIEDLKRGFYQVCITSDSQMITRRFVKQD